MSKELQAGYDFTKEQIAELLQLRKTVDEQASAIGTLKSTIVWAIRDGGMHPACAEELVRVCRSIK